MAALSTMLGNDQEGVAQLAAELEDLGFSRRLASGEWNWEDVDPIEMFSGLGQPPEDRVRHWHAINETNRPQDAIVFVVDVLGSRLERESTAAAAVLWRQLGTEFGPLDWRRLPIPPYLLWDFFPDVWSERLPDRSWLDAEWFGPVPSDTLEDADDLDPLPWDPEGWLDVYRRALRLSGDPYANMWLVALLSRLRLSLALRSPDPLTRSFALAAFPPPDHEEVVGAPPIQPPVTPPGALVVSTMIHGTWGWKGDWWRPRSEFHEFILRNHRPNLYSRGAKFSWSGSYRGSHRAQAAMDFCDWAYDVAPNGLQSVFGHSFGGEVGARALANGARLVELVLLSVPVTRYVERTPHSNARVVDVRLRFDPVLALARTRQRLPSRPNVTAVLLDGWRLDHRATHREAVWRAENVALRGGI